MDASVFGALLDLGLDPRERDEFNYTALDEVRNMAEGPLKKELTSLLIERGLFPASAEQGNLSALSEAALPRKDLRSDKRAKVPAR